MLRNERYRGVSVWGRTKKGRDPETGRKVSRATPESNWRRVEVPEWRIIPDRLWQSVQARRQRTEANFHQHGGMNRTELGRRYLFSGSLFCGLCGGSIVICAGGGKRGYVKYGCHAHKHNGACENKLMIRQDRLEAQLLAAIEERVLHQGAIEAAITRCGEELRRRVSEMERQGEISTVDSLKKDLEDRKRRQRKIIEAIETAGNIGSLSGRLRDLEREIEQIQDAIPACRPINVEKSIAELRSLVTKTVMTLKESLANGGEGKISRAKKALSDHVGSLMLTPGIRDARPVYQVSGGVTLAPPNAQKCRMQLVARDGIGTPTVPETA